MIRAEVSMVWEKKPVTKYTSSAEKTRSLWAPARS